MGDIPISNFKYEISNWSLQFSICNLQFEISFSAFLGVSFQQFQGHQPDSDADGRVCNIEGGPMIGHEMEIEEINHLPVSKSIDEVSHGSTQNEGKREGKRFFTLFDSKEEKNDGSNGKEGHTHKENGTEPALFPSENPESASSIPDMGEIKKTPDDFHPLVKREFPYNQGLGPLVQQENPDTENQKDPVFSFHASLIDESIPVQNSFPDLSS